MTAYAELGAMSNFSFLEGALHPEEIAAYAAALGYRAFALTDVNTLAGVVRAHVAAQKVGIPFIVGCRLRFSDGAPDILCYPTDRAAYGRLSRLLTIGKRRTKKGACDLALEDLEQHAEGQCLIALPPLLLDDVFETALHRIARFDCEQTWLGLSASFVGRSTRRMAHIALIAKKNANASNRDWRCSVPRSSATIAARRPHLRTSQNDNAFSGPPFTVKRRTAHETVERNCAAFRKVS